MRYIIIALLLVSLLGCASNDPVRKVQMTDNEIAQLWLNGRCFPSFALQPVVAKNARTAQDHIPPVQGKEQQTAIPYLINHQTGEAFCHVENGAPWNNFTWGDVYYCDGEGEPELIYSGNATSTYLCDGFIWCIIVHSCDIIGTDIIINSQPARIDVVTGECEYLDDASDSPAWNYIVAQDSDSYAYFRTDWDRTGDGTIYHDGSSWTLMGSILMPDMDSDIMVWTEYHGAFPAGEEDIYIYDLETRTKQLYYSVPDTIYNNPDDFSYWAAEYSHIVGDNIAWTVVIYHQSAGGALDNVPYLNKIPLPHRWFRWCGGISLNDKGWCAYQGSNYGASANRMFTYIDGELYDLDDWNAAWIESWHCLGDDLIYAKLPNRSINRVNPEGGNPEMIDSYGSPVHMVSTKNRKASAM